MRGRSKAAWWGVVLEAPDAHALAAFYSRLLGWPVSVTEENGAAIQVPGTSSYLSFDNSPDYVPPVWPADGGRQRMMMHIDIAVDDLAAAVSSIGQPATARADRRRSWRARLAAGYNRPVGLPTAPAASY